MGGGDVTYIPGSRDLIHDPRIATAIRRLKTMGLTLHIEPVSSNVVIIAIDSDSIMKFIKRKVEAAIEWDKKVVGYMPEERMLVVGLWKGPKPEVIEKLELEILKSQKVYEEKLESGEGGGG